MRYLRNYWAERLLQNDRIHLNTSLDPRFSCCLSNVYIDGINTSGLGTYMWDRHRIIVTPINHAEFHGLRITPNVCTTLGSSTAFAMRWSTSSNTGSPPSAGPERDLPREPAFPPH